MNVKSIERKGNEATVVVEIDKELMESGVNKAYMKARKSIQLPGFRKGKAPRKMIEAMYGAHVFYEDGLEEIFPEIYDFAIAKQDFKAIGRPNLTDMQIGDDNIVTLTLTTEVYPEVTLGQYKGLEVEKEEVNVTDEQVQAELDRMAQNVASTETVERPAQMGDTANIDFEGFDNGVPFEGGKGDNFDLKLGSGQFVPGFEEQIVGMNIGDEKDINITFPEDYTAELAGKDVVFKVKLNGLSMTELPELDDDFVQDVSEFNTVEEYRADTRKDMERVMDEQMDAKFRTAIMTKACDNMTVEIPESMMQEKIDELIRSYAANFGLTDPKMSTDDIKKMMGLDEEAIDSTIRPAAEYQVKQELLLNAIVDAENIEVTDEELEDYIKGAAETVGATPEQIRQYFGDEYIRNEFKKEKATKIVIESATEEAPAEEPAEKEAE